MLDKKLLSVTQTCIVLGLGETTVRALIRSGTLPSHRFGDGGRQVIRVPESAVRAYMAAHRAPVRAGGEEFDISA